LSGLWDFTAKTKADFALRSEPRASRAASGAINSEQVSFGAVIIHFARTFFERENDPESGSRPAAAR